MKLRKMEFWSEDGNNIKTIAFPAISTGIFGFAVEKCAKIMLQSSIKYLQGQTSLEKIVFCLFSEKDYRIFEKILKEVSAR